MSFTSVKRNCQLHMMKIESLGRLLFSDFFSLYIYRTVKTFTAVEFVKISFTCFLTYFALN